MVLGGGGGGVCGRMMVISLLRLTDDEGGDDGGGGGGGGVGSIGGPSPDVTRRLESDLGFTGPGPGEPGKPSTLRRRRRMIASSSEFILLLLSCGCCRPFVAARESSKSQATEGRKMMNYYSRQREREREYYDT